MSYRTNRETRGIFRIEGQPYVEPQMQMRSITHQNEDYVILYHGTRGENVPIMLEEGVKTGSDIGRLPMSYTTANRYSARAYAGDAGKVLVLKIPRTWFEVHFSGGDLIDKEVAFNVAIPPEFIVGVVE